MIDYKQNHKDIQDIIQLYKKRISDELRLGAMEGNNPDFRFDFSFQDKEEIIIYFHCKEYEKYLRFKFIGANIINIIDYHYVNRSKNIDESINKDSYIMLPSVDLYEISRFINSFVYDMSKDALFTNKGEENDKT